MAHGSPGDVAVVPHLLVSGPGCVLVQDWIGLLSCFTGGLGIPDLTSDTVDLGLVDFGNFVNAGYIRALDPKPGQGNETGFTEGVEVGVFFLACMFLPVSDGHKINETDGLPAEICQCAIIHDQIVVGHGVCFGVGGIGEDFGSARLNQNTNDNVA